MNTKDWFRKESWTEADQSDFFNKLDRCGDKVQYLKIQAVTFLQSGNKELVKPVIELVQLALKKADNGNIWLSSLYTLLGMAHEELGDYVAAATYYLNAIEVEKQDKRVQTNPENNLASLVLKNKLTKLIPEVKKILVDKEKSGESEFPVQRFVRLAALATIEGKAGNKSIAKSYAEAALLEAEREHSGFAKHPKLGLVGKEFNEIIGLLKKAVERS